MSFNLKKYNPFSIENENKFNEIALNIFRFQSENNEIYKKYIENINVSKITHYKEIPFLPIEFFKSHKVVSVQPPFDKTFLSSGTAGIRSNHFVKDISIYEKSFKKSVNYFYPNFEERVIIALLPNYLNQGNSSLVYMVNHLIKRSKHNESGFYLGDKSLKEKLELLEYQNKKIIIIGVSYALLDFIENNAIKLSNAIIMETGGMKGRRKEIIREELHTKLKKGFEVNSIHSEYGMTELLSQAFALKEGIFSTPPWMKILIREPNDPFNLLENEKTGGINIIDLANIYSCSFIATQDLGKKYNDGTFKVLGRFDNGDIRGCNLMIE